MFREGLEIMPGEELLNLSMIQIYVLHASQKRIEMNQRKKEEEEIKLVSNFESYVTPKVTKLVQTLGEIANPHDQYKSQ